MSYRSASFQQPASHICIFDFYAMILAGMLSLLEAKLTTEHAFVYNMNALYNLQSLSY